MQTKEITQLKNEIEDILNDNKAIEVKSINLKGKTSIADILMGLYEPSSGNIKIDENNVNFKDILSISLVTIF